MRDLLCRHINWQRYDGRKRDWVQADPPLAIAATILARAGEWKFPTIAGVISTPTMRPDGSLLTEPGFDAATRLLLGGTATNATDSGTTDAGRRAGCSDAARGATVSNFHS